MTRKARPGGPWPRLGDEILVRDSEGEQWKQRRSAGGGWYFHDEYGTDVWPIQQWRPIDDGREEVAT